MSEENKNIATYEDGGSGSSAEPEVIAYFTNSTDLTTVADAIRSKTGKTDKLVYPSGFASEIEKLSDTSTDTVTADKLVSGVTAHDKSGAQITGTMEELAGLAYTGGDITTPGSGGSYSIPASYFLEDTRYVKGNDETVVNVSIPKTKFGAATASDVIKGKTFTSSEGIAQTGTYTPPLDTSDATATASDIASPKTAYVNGTKVTGTKEEVDHFKVYADLSNMNSYNFQATVIPLTSKDMSMSGYVQGKEYELILPKALFGTASASAVLNGNTFTSTAGANIEGNMPNNGAASIQLSDLTAKSVTAGYYSGGTAKIADAEAAKIIPENIKKGVTILGVEGTMEEGGVTWAAPNA